MDLIRLNYCVSGRFLGVPSVHVNADLRSDSRILLDHELVFIVTQQCRREHQRDVVYLNRKVLLRFFRADERHQSASILGWAAMGSSRASEHSTSAFCGC